MTYIANPNNSKKQTPQSNAVTQVESYGRAETPAMKTFADRPNYVIVNKEGVYGFSYENTGSVGGVHDNLASYVTGSVLDDAAGPVRLDINPVAWRQTDAAGTAGDVTFVYIGDVG